jgi:outer membrane receptor protein involved in Fe transport
MDGWATQYVTGQEAPAARDIVGRLTLDYKPTDNFDANLKVTIDSYHDNGTSSYDNLLYCGGPGNTPAPLSLFWPQESAPCVRGFKDANAITGLVGYPNTHTEPSYTAEQSYATALNMHWRQSFGELTSVTSWNSYVLDAFLYSGIGADVNGFGAIPGQNNNENKTYSQELRYQTKFDSPVNFLFGGYAQHASFDAFESFALAPMAIMQAPWSTVHNEGVNSDSLAFFGEAQWAILSNLSFDASARWTQVRKMFHWNNTACGGFFCPAFPVYGIQGDRTFDNVSPQATLTWQATDDVMAYAAYKTGFLAGGYSETGTMGPNETAANFNFGNESAKGGEVGSKFFLANRSLYFDASAFYYQYTGLQVSTYDPATTAFAVQNAGKSINEGVELNGQWNTGTGFKFSGNVVYLNSYYAQFVGSCLYGASSPATYFACNVLTPAGTYEQNFKGTPTDFAPKWAGRVAVDYDTNVGDYLIHAGTGLGFTSSYSESQIPIEPGYVKVDAQLSVDKGPWSAAFKGLNLNNVADCSQVAGRPLSTADFPNARIGGEIDCVLERGRQLRFEITRRF